MRIITLRNKLSDNLDIFRYYTHTHHIFMLFDRICPEVTSLSHYCYDTLLFSTEEN